MGQSGVTRLRFISAKTAEEITLHVSGLGRRIHVYDIFFNPVEKLFYLFFVPGDGDAWSPDNMRLEEL